MCRLGRCDANALSIRLAASRMSQIEDTLNRLEEQQRLNLPNGPKASTNVIVGLVFR
jgi:hypothetical protein